MKHTAIIYSSKYGTTEQVGKSIGSLLKGQTAVTLIDLSQPICLPLDGFDTFVLGTSIYAGHPRQQMVRFCQEHLPLLLRKTLFRYVCGMDRAHAIREMTAAFPSELIMHAEEATFIAGEYQLGKMSLLERLLLRCCFKVKRPVYRHYPPLIRDFALHIGGQ